MPTPAEILTSGQVLFPALPDLLPSICAASAGLGAWNPVPAGHWHWSWRTACAARTHGGVRRAPQVPLLPDTVAFSEAAHFAIFPRQMRTVIVLAALLAVALAAPQSDKCVVQWAGAEIHTVFSVDVAWCMLGTNRRREVGGWDVVAAPRTSSTCPGLPTPSPPALWLRSPLWGNLGRCDGGNRTDCGCCGEQYCASQNCCWSPLTPNPGNKVCGGCPVFVFCFFVFFPFVVG